MDIPILDAKIVDSVIRRAGKGRNHGKKVSDIALRTCASERTLHTYLKEGAKKGPLNVLLWQLAVQHGIVTSDENTSQL